MKFISIYSGENIGNKFEIPYKLKEKYYEVFYHYSRI